MKYNIVIWTDFCVVSQIPIAKWCIKRLLVIPARQWGKYFFNTRVGVKFGYERSLTFPLHVRPVTMVNSFILNYNTFLLAWQTCNISLFSCYTYNYNKHSVIWTWKLHFEMFKYGSKIVFLNILTSSSFMDFLISFTKSKLNVAPNLNGCDGIFLITLFIQKHNIKLLSNLKHML